MRVEILGSLQIWDDGGSVATVEGPRLRVLLAALAMHANQPVPLEWMAEILWDGKPPPSAMVTIRGHVKRLRRILGPAAARIVTRDPGYLVVLAERELDLTHFQALCYAGHAAVRGGNWHEAQAKLERALAMWRGDPLVDIPSETLRGQEVPRLEQLRLQAVEHYIEASLHLGWDHDLVPQLFELTGRHPLREHLHAQLMFALARAGRQAEALVVYQQARSALVEGLGIEPGPELREMQARILGGDPTLAAPPSSIMQIRGTTVVPHQLPAAVPHFIGRQAELATLTDLLDQTSATSGAVVISAIGGMAGIGKTALAVNWAHRVADRFVDGQLYVNLRGYDLQESVTAGDALAAFLRALGMPVRDIPAELDERAAAYRSMLAERRILLIIDNARTCDDVRPLLPGAPSCAVVVTSRDTLAGLVARDGAVRVELDVLPADQAVWLLRELVGERVDADMDGAARLAECCGMLPLALRVAAELALSRDTTPLTDLADELTDLRRRLDALNAGGDHSTSVRAVFSWSYDHLDPGAAQGFRLAGLHPGPDFDLYALAALAGTPTENAKAILDVLARAHLIQPTGVSRYSMHDLLRGYARELVTRDGDVPQRAALTRLFDYYLHTAAVAMNATFPAERHRRPSVPRPDTPVPVVTDEVTALSWLDVHRPCLVAMATQAVTGGWPDHAIRLSAMLYRYLEAGGHFVEAAAIHGHARDAAARVDDQAAEAGALISLGALNWLLGRDGPATDCYQQALTLLRDTDDRFNQARVLANLGMLSRDQGRNDLAANHFHQALVICREIGDRVGEARVLDSLGLVDSRQGHYHQADVRVRQALRICLEIGDRLGEAEALAGIGMINFRSGRYPQAIDYQEQALVLYREMNNRIGEADVLRELGTTRLRQGDRERAVDHLQHALVLYRKTGDQRGEAAVLNGLGEILLAIGRPNHARTEHTDALHLAHHIGDKTQQAQAHQGLADTHHALGQPGPARSHRQQALLLYAELGRVAERAK